MRKLAFLAVLVAALILPASALAITNMSPPVVTGSTVQGQTLTTSNGAWNPTPATYSYKWRRVTPSGPVVIAGATSSSYTLQAADVGDSIRSVVAACTSGGSCSNAVSAAVGPVTAGGGGGTTGFQSVVYWPGWLPPASDAGTIPIGDATQVNYFSLASCVSATTPDEPDCTGPASIDVDLNSVTDSAAFVSAVHANGQKAMISIGGSTNPNWHYPCQASSVATFAANVSNFAHSNGFDGVDLDIEQDPTTGSPQLTAAELQACTQDVAADVHAWGGLVTSAVDPTTDLDIPPLQAPYVDQFNAMSYEATTSQEEVDLTNLTSLGIPAAKITMGNDIEDIAGTDTAAFCSSGTGGTAQGAVWAAQHGFGGYMIWFGQHDEANGYRCLNAVKPNVG